MNCLLAVDKPPTCAGEWLMPPGTRISRPCYDKPHRCPGWAGGGMRTAKVDRCVAGRVNGQYGPLWQWRFHRCDTCPVVVLPYVVRWLDPRWLRFVIADRLERQP